MCQILFIVAMLLHAPSHPIKLFSRLSLLLQQEALYLLILRLLDDELTGGLLIRRPHTVAFHGGTSLCPANSVLCSIITASK